MKTGGLDPSWIQGFGFCGFGCEVYRFVQCWGLFWQAAGFGCRGAAGPSPQALHKRATAQDAMIVTVSKRSVSSYSATSEVEESSLPTTRAALLQAAWSLYQALITSMNPQPQHESQVIP